MNRIGTTLSQVLVGSLPEGCDLSSLRAEMLDSGRAPHEVVVLAGSAGLEELLGHDQGHGIFGHLTHLVRHLEALESEGTGHVLSAAESDLRSGRIVVLVRHVDRAAAAPLADVLHRHGVTHVHYIGRWTVAEQGGVPSIAA
jgi:hypothetical protein